MTGKDLTLNLEPSLASMDDMTVTAEVKSVGSVCEVVVVFSRSNGQPPMEAAAVQVEMIGSDGGTLETLEAPNGLLPEFGGGLGTSVNARYRFRMGALPPVQLMVRYRTGELTFRLVSAHK